MRSNNCRGVIMNEEEQKRFKIINQMKEKENAINGAEKETVDTAFGN